jgi:voltage-gated potassium channel
VSIPAGRTGSRPPKGPWLVAFRSLAEMVVLVALYYALPLNHVKNVPVMLVTGLVILSFVTVVQLRLISRSTHPELRAIEALATTIPLFLLLFASGYFIMAGAGPANFNPPSLTRTDALYFTVSVFSSVGFGDISAAGQSARLVVTVQMLLDLLALGLVLRAFVNAVQSARRQATPDARPGQDGEAG